ncbi:MAG: sodium/panthothenate symporter [Euryarchaeota archaeon ADurb.Bin023]|jgi:SSS family solute:Na+ symporter|nr:sodium:solute symporter family protein [Methanofastidiosum sp.]OQC51814.1 MAG: sodium/panthothenate symporter [Euryarchaeota archaeon ADurb.Bin023]HNV94517.1 sodium:solute symporter family protein [Methanofastidiosum sp.]HOE92391.1 sodium:solute symporter family protein [Methanofastidiosum sp.]HOR87541.1 sodium:solute symporter family protein [Methanofastidiosum sp.]
MNNILILIIIYAIIGSIVALFSKGPNTQESFFIGSRNIGGIVSALTYAATTYSAFMMVGLVGLSYATGVGALGFELTYLVGTLFFLSYYGPKIWKIAREKGIVSPSGLLEERYGKKTSKIVAIISLLALIPYTSVQLTGVGLILETNSNLDFTTSILIVGVIIALWAFVGGLRGVALTDSLQGAFMIIVSIFALIWVAYRFEYTSLPSMGNLMYVPNAIWTPSFFIGLTLPWFFFALTNPQVLQRLFIPKDLHALRKMIIYFGFFGLVYTVIVTYIGISLKILTFQGLFPIVQYRDNVTPTLLSLMPEWLSLLLALSIMAAAITTANSIVLTLSSMVSRDILKEKGIFYGRISIVVLTIFIGLFAVRKISYIVELSVLSSTILLCVLPLIFGIFHYKIGKDFTGAVTLIGGFLITILLTIFKLSLFGLPTPVTTLIVCFTIFFVIGKIESEYINKQKS